MLCAFFRFLRGDMFFAGGGTLGSSPWIHVGSSLVALSIGSVWPVLPLSVFAFSRSGKCKSLRG